jgi:fucose 4-O-acetylase-like acetyltransferase
MNDKDTKRIVYFDLLRGFAIFSVIIEHIIQQSNLQTWQSNPIVIAFTSFNMCLFMFLSGFMVLTRSLSIQSIKSLWNFSTKKGVQLFLPFVIWYFVVDFFVVNKYNHSFKDHFCLIVDRQDFGLWFLWALFVISICFAIICFVVNKCEKIKINKLFLDIGLGICMFLMLALWKYFNFTLLRFAGYYFPFFYAGYLMSKYGVIKKILENKYTILVSFLIYIILIRDYTFGADLPIYHRYLLGLTGIIVIYNFVKNNSDFKPCNQLFQIFGKSSLIIYCVHGYFLRDINVEFDYVLLQLIVSLVYAVIICFGCLIFHKIIEIVPILNLLLFGISPRKNVVKSDK